MKDIGLFFRTVIEKKKLKQNILANKAGYSQSHFWQLLQKEDLTCSQLERISNAIGINPIEVFELENPDEVCSVQQTDQTSSGFNSDYVNNMLTEKNERIKVLEKNVKLLEDLLSMYRDKFETNELKKAN